MGLSMLCNLCTAADSFESLTSSIDTLADFVSTSLPRVESAALLTCGHKGKLRETNFELDAAPWS